MAFYDNKLWLLSHIHNSFISSDDTGVCEMVLGAENFKEELRTVAKHQGLESFVGCISDEEDEDDIDNFRQRSPDLNFTVSETREKTKTEQVKQVAPWTKITWKEGKPDTADLEKFFPRKDIPALGRVVDRTSLLTKLLEETPQTAPNPWQEFVKFDADGFPDIKFVKNVVIFFPMTEGDDAVVPLRLVCTREARVSDLIGLACYKYTNAGRKPPLKPPVENFSLYMCEEDGSVDWDFPSLDQGDPFNKYGFTQLALVEKPSSEHEATCVTLHMPDGTFSQIEVQKRDITVGELMDRALERRRNFLSQTFKFTYHVEVTDTPGVALDPATPVHSTGESEFYIVRDNSKRVSGPRDAAQGEVSFWEAHLFQSFTLEIFTKVRTKVEIHLGISGEKVEIDPCQQTSSAKFWSKQKAVSYAMDKIVSCEVMDKKQKGEREVFRMVYLTEGGWNQREFEGEKETVAQVVQKLNHLLDLRQSEARKLRKEYLENKEKKKLRSRTVTK